MNNLLDAPEQKRLTGNTFSKLSLGTSLLTLALLGWLIVPRMTVIRVSDAMQPVSFPLVLLLYASCFAGVVFTLLSFIRKERNSFPKWAGAILNILLFVVLAGSILYAMQVDMMRG